MAPEQDLFGRFVELLARYRLGDIASLLGLILGVIGFGLTLWGVRKSRRAAEAAEDAVMKMRANLERMDFVADCSSAIAILEEVRRLHRAKAWPILLDRYSILKRLLISVRGAGGLSEHNKGKLQGAIQHLATMENKVEKVLAGSEDPDIVRLNKVISRQIEDLAQVMIEVRSQIGG